MPKKPTDEICPHGGGREEGEGVSVGLHQRTGLVERVGMVIIIGIIRMGKLTMYNAGADTVASVKGRKKVHPSKFGQSERSVLGFTVI